MILSLRAIVLELTPPVLAAALAGVFFLLFRRQKLTLPLRALSLFFFVCLLWRLGAPLISRRYAGVLLFPAVVLGCYALLSIRDQLLRWRFFDNIFWKRALCVFLFAAPLGLLLKSWHFNPYADGLKEICAVARTDAARRPHASTFLDFTRNSDRISFFSKLPIDHWQREIIGKNAPEKQISGFRRALRRSIGSNSTVYVFMKKSSGDPDLFPEDAAVSRWGSEKLAERYVNRKRKHKWVLYRFTPKNGISSRGIPAPPTPGSRSGKNFLMNGDFEKTETLEKQKKACERYVAGRSLFFADRNKLIPQRISISHLPGGELGADAEIEACSAEPLAGAFSLRMKSESTIFACIAQDIPSESYRLSFWLKSRRPSLLNLYAVPFSPWAGDMFRIATISVLPGETREYTLDISRDLVKHCHHFRLVFGLDFGEVLIDNVELHKSSSGTAFSRTAVLRPDACKAVRQKLLAGRNRADGLPQNAF